LGDGGGRGRLATDKKKSFGCCGVCVYIFWIGVLVGSDGWAGLRRVENGAER
jgi:hypothetical protein